MFSFNRLRELAHRPIGHHLDTLSWHYHRLEYFAFTRKYSLEFDGFVPRDKLVTEFTESVADSHNYRPYTNFHVKRLLQEALSTGMQFDNFVDVGCGKGLPCIFAKKYFHFENVFGIDFSEPLIDVAKRNASKTPYKNMHFLVADATTWSLPSGNSLVLLNSPFNEVILEKFLNANLEHFDRYRSLIAYGNDHHLSTLCRLGFEVIYRSNRLEQSILSRGSNVPRRQWIAG